MADKKPHTVSMTDVAAKAGVSTMTVSRVISGTGAVKPATVERVQAAAEALGYVINKTSASFSTQRSHTIGVILPANGYRGTYVKLLDGISGVLSAKGYEMLVGYDQTSTEMCANVAIRFLSHRVDGLLIIGTDYLSQISKFCQSCQTPVVQVFEDAPNPIGTSLGCSHLQMGATITQHLLERGYQDILAVQSCATLEQNRFTERNRGIHSVLDPLGISLRTHNVDYTLDLEGANKLLQELCEQDRLPQVLLLHQEYFAFGVLLAAQRLGLRIKDDLAIASFGWTELSRYTCPSLTVVWADIFEMGKQAAEVLLNQIEGQEQPSRPIISFSHELIRGEST